MNLMLKCEKDITYCSVTSRGPYELQSGPCVKLTEELDTSKLAMLTPE